MMPGKTKPQKARIFSMRTTPFAGQVPGKSLRPPKKTSEKDAVRAVA